MKSLAKRKLNQLVVDVGQLTSQEDLEVEERRLLLGEGGLGQMEPRGSATKLKLIALLLVYLVYRGLKLHMKVNRKFQLYIYI